MALTGEIQLDRKWKSGIFQTLSNFRHFSKIIRELKPNAIVVNCELPELYAALLLVKIQNLVCVEHTSKPWAGREIMGKLVRGILLLRKPTWVTVNKSQTAVWPFRTSAIYIPNPVETPKLATAGANTADFVFVGRLRKEKGIESILEASTAANIKIDVFGSGNLEDGLKTKYNDVAIFHGFVDNPWNFISPEQVLIVASEYEGDGKVIVEGILAGLPILLLDNLDLRRFDLPNRNYFTDGIDLIKKINECLVDRQAYRPKYEKIVDLKNERETATVVSSWRKLLV
jgi:glycosyltransferase involved in cell wall biosynthesis